MKLLAKISILTMLIAFVSSCQKEILPTPKDLPSQQVNSSGLRKQNSPTADSVPSHTILKDGDENTGPGDIVGGGDDDRDGGEKKPKKGE